MIRTAPALPELISCRKIRGRAPHSAFTDLVRFRGEWFCTFREARDHAGSPGRLRLLVSNDGLRWRSCARLAEPGVDLRDPKLSVTPDGELMLLAGGTFRRSGPGRSGPGRPGPEAPLARRPRVFFSPDGRRWSRPRTVLAEGDWLWRATWYGGRAYGVSYRLPAEGDWTLHLVESDDGLSWREIRPLEVPGRPNETTVRFRKNGEMIALVRREAGDRQGWIGTSLPPYEAWSWRSVGQRLGGPNFLVLPDGTLWAAGRRHKEDGAVTAVGPLRPAGWEPLLDLPSGGDCSYPGMVWHEGLLWISYYSSHEGRAAVYLARVRLP